MKGPAYVAAAVAAYRHALDNPQADHASFEKELLQTFNRGGASTTGYLFRHASASMIGVDTSKNTGLEAGFVKSVNQASKTCVLQFSEAFSPGDGYEIICKSEPRPGGLVNREIPAGQTFSVPYSPGVKAGDLIFKTFDKALNDKLLSQAPKDPRKLAVNGEFSAEADSPAHLALKLNGLLVECVSNVLEAAKGIPTSNEEAMARLSKTGATPFAIHWDSFEMKENFFLPASQANSLRREACGLMEAKILESSRRNLSGFEVFRPESIQGKQAKMLTVRIPSAALLDAALAEGVERIVIPLAEAEKLLEASRFDEVAKACHLIGASLYVSLPIAGELSSDAQSMLESSPMDGYCASRWGQISQLGESSKKLHADWQLQIMNRQSLEFATQFAHSATLSPELDLQGLQVAANEQAEIIAYGRLPLMTTRQCPVGNFAAKRGEKFCSFKDKTGNSFVLIDRKGFRLPLLCDCSQCVCQILNNAPQDWLRKLRDISSIPAGRVSLSFTVESADDIRAIVDKWISALKVGKAPPSDAPFTYGLLYRGVE
jgi:putative protease